MITFVAYKDVGMKIDQWCVPPTVYLDHWAWRRIFDSTSLAADFSRILKAKGGTLAVSWLNLIEFSKVTDAKQAASADALLDHVLPHVSFVNPNFFTVIEKENKLQAGGDPTAPHADPVFLKFFAKHNLLKSHSLKLLPEQNIFQLVQLTGVGAGFMEFANKLVSRIETLRVDYKINREFSRLVRRVPQGQPIQRGTRFIARELLGTFLRDSSGKLDRNNAIDVCHAIVPVAYCDFVLLDKRWATHVEQARKRIIQGGLQFPIAQVFSERENGIAKFLQQLQST
jgi:hypothetical protein